jgi:hypothetical protein
MSNRSSTTYHPSVRAGEGRVGGGWDIETHSESPPGEQERGPKPRKESPVRRIIASSHRRARDPPRSQSLGSRMDRRCRCCYRRDRMANFLRSGCNHARPPSSAGLKVQAEGRARVPQVLSHDSGTIRTTSISPAPGCLRRNMACGCGG